MYEPGNPACERVAQYVRAHLPANMVFDRGRFRARSPSTEAFAAGQPVVLREPGGRGGAGVREPGDGARRAIRVRRASALAFALVLGAACTEVTTDPNTWSRCGSMARRHPSIVAGDSLRDSLGASQPLRATGSTTRAIRSKARSSVVFDRRHRVRASRQTGDVFATRRSRTATPARVFATVGKTPERADSSFVVQRADSIRR